MPLRRSLLLLVTVIAVALAGGAVALAPRSSGQSTGTGSPTCKPANDQRLPLAKGLTIYTTPNPVTATRQLTVFGRLVGVRKGVHRCGISVVLWRQFPSQHGFSPVARTSTNAAGTYSFQVTPYRVRVGSGKGGGGVGIRYRMTGVTVSITQ